MKTSKLPEKNWHWQGQDARSEFVKAVGKAGTTLRALEHGVSSDLPFCTRVIRDLERLGKLKIVEEYTGKERDRDWIARDIISVIEQEVTISEAT